MGAKSKWLSCNSHTESIFSLPHTKEKAILGKALFL